MIYCTFSHRCYDICALLQRPSFPIGSCLSPENVTWCYNISTNMTPSVQKVAEENVIYRNVSNGTYEVGVVPTVVELDLSATLSTTHFG